MKLDKYNVAQSSQSIEELTKEFFQYKGKAVYVSREDILERI